MLFKHRGRRQWHSFSTKMSHPGGIWTHIRFHANENTQHRMGFELKTQTTTQHYSAIDNKETNEWLYIYIYMNNNL